MIDDDEFVEFIAQATDPEVVFTREVAEHVDMSIQGVSKRLNDLEAQGRIASKSGGTVKVWYIPDDSPDADSSD